ncbi:MAG: hypothetical protein US86_C0001G0169 [Candidatus Daviesbacteria bacterium GW2011_GWA2_38_24]|uniref:EamA domain-containing protein n=1 Tax=Candidatus Daviesbacteria bacterium GW2011_GWA2_38_24 TaxID=1618422 RepID=A0A0G0JK78_9BACT|nr:MAG: hypothetical protein US86_C0001G0169 [Candidatus Daviesbacteria bacterium GW2011_GWA2_38_24]OGE24566.1 MAG: hypothetical protein A2688_02425 [Candidatus Daviesbacteria bacterium RIFCSPHIGHO2_01_FULL_38_8]
MPSILFIFLATFIAVIGNITLKSGMKQLGNFQLDLSSKLFEEIFRIFTNPVIIVGIILYVVSMIFWLKVLSQEDVSRAFPIMVGINFTLLSIGSFFILQESFTLSKILGILIIFVGIFVATRV